MLLQQGTHGLFVSHLDRLHQPKIAAGGGQAGDRQQRYHPPATQAFDFATHTRLSFHSVTDLGQIIPNDAVEATHIHVP